MNVFEKQDYETRAIVIFGGRKRLDQAGSAIERI